MSAAFLFQLFAFTVAPAADISLAKVDAFDDQTFHLHIEGVIEPGDAARVRDLTRGVPEGRDVFLAVSLNSPGGSVQDGLEIAGHFQSLNLQVITDVMTLDGRPGSCASACSFIFLGGNYRFLLEGSKLGVHQFRYAQDMLMPLSETTRAVQALSADITRLLSEARVDPGFFSLMGDTAPEEMTWVDLPTLEGFNVVNRERAFQENDITLPGGQVQLVMTHIGIYGVNRLTATCLDGDMLFKSEILLSDHLGAKTGLGAQLKIAERFQFSVLVDRYRAKPQLVLPQTFDGTVITTQFSLPKVQLATLLSANLIDVRLVEESGLFVGAGFDVRDGRARDIVESCVELTPQPSSSLGGNQDIDVTLSPVLVAASLGGSTYAPAPVELTPRSGSLENDAIEYYEAYLAAWSEDNKSAMAFMDAQYAETIDFYGNLISKGELLLEKQKFAERWPDRHYTARQDTFEVSCKVEGVCLVAALIDWEAHSAARGKSASGIAWYGLGFDMSTGEVFFENGESRRR